MQRNPTDDLEPINTDVELSESESTQSFQSTETERGEQLTMTDSKTFGNSLQQYSQKLTNALSKFTINKSLEDGGYTQSYRPMYEALCGLGFDSYITKKDYVDNSLKTEENTKTKFLISVWILSQCDGTNADRARDELKTIDPDTRMENIDYDPFKLWEFLRTYHHEITEEKLNHLTQALHSFKQHRSDTLRTHIDKFSALLNDFYTYHGEMSLTQAAQTLINSLKPGNKITVKMVYRTINPLTFTAVKKVLLKVQDKEEFQTPSMVQENGATSSQSINSNASDGRMCTVDRCVGDQFQLPHNAKDCFKRPKNFDKRDAWILKKEEQRKRKFRKSKPSGNSSSVSNVRGIKRLTKPAHASGAMLSFQTVYDTPELDAIFESHDFDKSDNESYATAPEYANNTSLALALEKLASVKFTAPVRTEINTVIIPSYNNREDLITCNIWGEM